MTTHTVNAHGVDPATVTQAHAERVAAALGLAGAERIGCGGFYMGPRIGWLAITREPHSSPNSIKVPWALVAGLGEARTQSIAGVDVTFAGAPPTEAEVYRLRIRVLESEVSRLSDGCAVAQSIIQQLTAKASLLVPKAMLEQVYGMAREGCEAPGAAYRWCERIDELFHTGQPSAEHAEWARTLPPVMADAAIRASETPKEAGHG